MFDRLRNGTLAGGVALAMALVFSGAVLGATVPADTSTASEDVPFVDLDGDGVADHCDDEVTEDAEAAQAAFDAADLNGDGEISVSEAAQTDWTGGLNCNHGGYVSEVAHGDSCAVDEEAAPDEGAEDGAEQGGDEAAPDEQPEGGDEDAEEGGEGDATVTDETVETDACTTDEEQTEEAVTADEETCEVVEAPEIDPETDTTTWNHGDWVSWVAKSDAVGGKNCNHGGAVSEASKAANEAKKAEREAAKAEREAAREAKKAERELKKAERAAARAAKGHGKH